jgi:hypothetical protein
MVNGGSTTDAEFSDAGKTAPMAAKKKARLFRDGPSNVIVRIRP